MFVIVTDSLSHVSVAITFQLVGDDLLYSIVAVGVTLSILLTVAVALHVNHNRSTKLKVNTQFHVNV